MYKSLRKFTLSSLFIFLFLKTDAISQEQYLLTATFGMNNGLGPQDVNFANLNPNCAGMNIDGLPLVFDRAIDANSIRTQDFAVVRSDGSIAEPFCAGLAPALNADEGRTILLLGDFGEVGSDPIEAFVRESAILQSQDQGISMAGQSQKVEPLESGQYLVTVRKQPLRTNIQGSCRTRGSRLQIESGSGMFEVDNPGVGYQPQISHFIFTTSSGQQLAPTGFGDLDIDNYLEICFASEIDSGVLTVFPNSFTDPNGDANSRIDIELLDGAF